jgi:hypothetical protein
VKRSAPYRSIRWNVSVFSSDSCLRSPDTCSRWCSSNSTLMSSFFMPETRWERYEMSHDGSMKCARCSNTIRRTRVSKLSLLPILQTRLERQQLARHTSRATVQYSRVQYHYSAVPSRVVQPYLVHQRECSSYFRPPRRRLTVSTSWRQCQRIQ